MKKVIQSISGIAVGIFVSFAIPFLGCMTMTYYMYSAEVSIHPLWISVPSCIVALYVVALCIRMREILLKYNHAEAVFQRIIIGLFVLPVLGAMIIWYGNDITSW